MVSVNIKRLRQNKNITQKELADDIGVTRQAVCMWEAGKREPTIAMLNEIARVFDVTLDEIIKLKPCYSIAERKEEHMVRKAQKKVPFEFMAPRATKVAITGDFSSWSKGGITLKKEKSGVWKAEVPLKTGRYEYKFIVDGQWHTDPSNKNIVRNTFGSENSVVEINA